MARRPSLADAFRDHLDEVHAAAADPVERAVATAVTGPGATAESGELGPRGWLVTTGAADLLAPYVPRLPRERHEVTPFDGLAGPDAAALLAALEAPPLAVREHDSPTLASFLRAAADHEQVRLFGYLVGPGRPDERVVVSGARVHGLPGRRPQVDDSLRPDETWDLLRRELKLDALAAPDDCRRKPTLLRGRDPYWLIWWA